MKTDEEYEQLKAERDELHNDITNHWLNRVNELAAERDNLKGFKQYVHKRLDDAGIPVDPESEHRAKGCRIGGRLDVTFNRMVKLEAERDQLLQWKKEHGIVESWWNEVGDYIQSQPSEGKLGWKLSDIALERLKERDKLKAERDKLRDRSRSLLLRSLTYVEDVPMLGDDIRNWLKSYLENK